MGSEAGGLRGFPGAHSIEKSVFSHHEGELYEQQGTYEIHMLQLRSGNFKVDGALSPVRGVEYAGGAGRNDGA